MKPADPHAVVRMEQAGYSRTAGKKRSCCCSTEIEGLGDGTQSIVQKEFRYDYSWMAGRIFESGKLTLGNCGTCVIRRCFTVGSQGSGIWIWNRLGSKIREGS